MITSFSKHNPERDWKGRKGSRGEKRLGPLKLFAGTHSDNYSVFSLVSHSGYRDSLFYDCVLEHHVPTTFMT